MTSTQSNVAKLCLDLDRKVAEYAESVLARAESDATYRSERAKRVLRARADGAKSIAEAETTADADDLIRDLRLRHLVTDGIADATQKSIAALRVRIEFGRSVISTERAQDTLHSQNLGGQA